MSNNKTITLGLLPASIYLEDLSPTNEDKVNGTIGYRYGWMVDDAVPVKSLAAVAEVAVDNNNSVVVTPDRSSIHRRRAA